MNARPFLPASAHARGRRPYTFKGEWFGEPVPGAFIRGDRITAPADAAWIFTDTFMASAPIGHPAVTVPLELIVDSPLYPFQRVGADFLASRDYALLSDEMGLGKTVQTLAACELRLTHARGADVNAPHVLILCPSIAKRHWQREVKRWTGHDAAVLDGMAAGDLPQKRYIICNYDIVYGQRRRDVAGKLHDNQKLGGWGKVLAAAKFPIVVCDEAHNLRGANTRRTTAIKEVCEDSTCVWLLTGTPIPNHVRDLWSLWDLASKGLAGKYWPWAKAYCGAFKGQYGWVADGQSGLEELTKRLSFWTLGRSKAIAGMELPEKRREIVSVDVANVIQAKVTAVNPTVGRTNAVAEALRRTAKAKQPAIIEMALEALHAGQKVVVFVYLRKQVEDISGGLHDHVPVGAYVIPVSGESSPDARDAAATEFRNHTGAACFIATIDSVGVAISLVGADLVIFGDLSWEPAKLLQAEGRVHRHGSTNRVLIRYLIAAGTIDEGVQETVIEKLATIETVTGQTGDDLAVTLGKDTSTSEDIISRLFEKLTKG